MAIKTKKIDLKEKMSQVNRAQTTVFTFMALTILTIIASALTAYITSVYFDLPKEIYGTNLNIVEGLSLTSSILGWILVLLVSGICAIAHKTFKGNLEPAKGYKKIKRLTALCLALSVLVFVLQAISNICCCQVVKWPETTGDKLSNCGLVASIISGLAMVSACFTMPLIEAKYNMLKPQAK